MFGLKLTEILLIFVVIMLLFGATRLPALGSSLGSAIRNFKKGFAGEETPEEIEAAKKLAAQNQAAPAAATDKQKQS